MGYIEEISMRCTLSTVSTGQFFQAQVYMISTKVDKKRFFSGPALTIASCNIKSINSNKKELLVELCKENLCDIFYVQET